MSHVDDGTLHAYLDGELPPAEARGLEAHVAECAGCRDRLEEERALIARADELLGLAAPPDRSTPPFRAGDLKPPARLWSQVRVPLAWAATVMVALGVGMYLGSGAATGRRDEAVTDRPTDVAAAREPPAARPLADTAAGARVEPRGRHRARSTQAPTPSGVAALERANAARVDTVASVAALAERAAPAPGAMAVSQGAPPAAPPVPAPATPLFSIDSARALLGQDPVALPDAPIRSMRREPAIGATIVVLEQALDSATVIELRERPAAMSGLVAGARDAAEERGRFDSLAPAASRERAAAKRVHWLADSIAVSPRARDKIVRERNHAVLRSGRLLVEISGPLTADSLGKLLETVKPIRP